VLNKIKNLDAADPNHKISYARITLGTKGWPSASTIKSVGTVVHTKLTIAAAVVQVTGSRTSRCVSVFIGRSATDEEKIIAMRSYGAVVDDVGKVPRLVRRLSWSGVAGLALDWFYADF
jgi:hypothetical protein